MIFKGVNNQTVEFKVTNYEFPEDTSGCYDSNWLLIYLNVDSDCGKWQTIDSSLLTDELIKLYDWFDKLSRDEKIEYELMDFIEPNISFELIDNIPNKKKIRILFDLESRPINADENKDYYVDFEYNNSELKELSERIKMEYEKFPTR